MSVHQQRVELTRKLRRLRVASGLTTYEVAERTGFSQSKVSRIENGKTLPTPTDTYKLTTALGSSPSVRNALSASAEHLCDPVAVLPGSTRTVPSENVLGVLSGSRRLRAVTGPYLFYYAQTPEYMLAIGNPNVVSRAPGRFISDKLRVAAESYMPGKDRVSYMPLAVLHNPVLKPNLWINQLRLLIESLAYVRDGFAILPEPVTMLESTAVYDRQIVLSESIVSDSMSFDRRSAQAAERSIDRLVDGAVWDTEAVRLIEAELRRYEITVDLREPQRYY